VGYFIQFSDLVNCVMHMFVNGTSGGSRNARMGANGRDMEVDRGTVDYKLAPIILLMQCSIYFCYNIGVVNFIWGPQGGADF